MSDEEVYKDEEENVTNEPDYTIPEPDYMPYVEEDQVVTERDRPLDVPMDLIRLGQKIKRHATIQRGQTTRKQSGRKKKGKAAHPIYL